MQKQISTPRLDGLDVARGLALIAMATYHFSWDLELFGYLEPGAASSGFLKFYARAIATSFLFIVGFSLVLATAGGMKWQSYFVRLAQVGAAALAISAATYFAMPSGWIFFGILHHIVLASLIGLIFVRLHWAIVPPAAIAAFALPSLDVVTTDAPWLSFIGLFSTAPNSNDFVPVFPWLSASLAGIAVAKFAVSNAWMPYLAKPKATKFPARQLKFLGRHSLLFYILHQPFLIGIVWLAAQIMPADQFVSTNFAAECEMICLKQFTANQCETYCNCFESELKDNAAQWSQLSVEKKSTAVSNLCSQKMHETPNP